MKYASGRGFINFKTATLQLVAKNTSKVTYHVKSSFFNFNDI